MIFIRLNGGLGNQLFQYAAARALAIKYQTSLVLDQGDLFVRHKTITERSYELYHFYLADKDGGNIYCKKSAALVVIRLLDIIKNLAMKLPDFYYKETSLDFQPIPWRENKILILQGYFQSHKYFEVYRRQLLEELSINQKISGENEAFLALIKQTNSVSLHVRRGDYISNPSAANFHGACAMEYYHQAIKLLESRYESLSYFIFSDDISWCREKFSFLENKNFVDCNSSLNAHLDLHLMRNCKYHIIANSSFSWWGAWLANYGCGTVLYPKQWFANEPVNYESRFPQEWEGI